MTESRATRIGLRIATGGLSDLSSSGRKMRPATGCTPSSGKKLAVTSVPCTGRASGPRPMVTLPTEYPAAALNPACWLARM